MLRMDAGVGSRLSSLAAHPLQSEPDLDDRRMDDVVRSWCWGWMMLLDQAHPLLSLSPLSLPILSNPNPISILLLDLLARLDAAIAKAGDGGAWTGGGSMKLESVGSVGSRLDLESIGSVEFGGGALTVGAWTGLRCNLCRWSLPLWSLSPF